MTTFDQLSTDEKTARLRKLGEAALERYGIVPAAMTTIATSWNTVFRVDAENGERYVLRVSLPHYTEPDGQGEIEWMGAIAGETDIPLPRPIRTLDGEPVVTASTPEVPEPRVCLLFSFVEGTMVNDPSPEDSVAWGELTARLHRFSNSYRPPHPTGRSTFRSILPFPHDRLVIFNDEFRELISPRHDLLREAMDRAQGAIDELYADESSRPILLHNDLHPWNILHHEGTYTVIDFEDMMWGFPVQDAGVALFYVLRRPDFRDILARYREGYTRHLPWFERREGELDDMMVVRDLHLLNVSLQMNLPDRLARLEKYLPIMEKRLRAWLATGSLPEG